MSVTETVWAFAPLVAALIALLTFSRNRRQTADYAESKAVKAELPGWVKLTELLSMVVFCAALAVATFKIFGLFRGFSRSADTLTNASAVYVVFGIGSLVLPLGLLAANLFSWIVPTLRQANERAFRGHQVSFEIANSGLIKFACISVPFGAVALCLAAIEPWAR